MTKINLGLVGGALLLAGSLVHAQPAEEALPKDIAYRRATIVSEGIRLAGDVFTLKENADKALPTIIMSHGWGGVAKSLWPQALEFARAGYFVVVFDYRGWGASEGRVFLTKPLTREKSTGPITAQVTEVREIIDPLDQANDLLNVIHWVHGEKQCDSKRIGLWGTSYSGGHVVYAAAKDPRIKATVSQVPGMDSKFVLIGAGRKQTLDEATKRARGEIGYPEPGIKAVGNLRGAPIRERLMHYAPVEDADKAPGCAMLFIIAGKEELFDNRDHGIKAHERAKGPKKLVTIPNITHYGIYNEARAQAQKLAIEWFDEHLKGKLKGQASARFRPFLFAAAAEPTDGPVQIHVGIDTGDIRGGDHRALQAAVDYVAGLGGGTVHIEPGRYVMRNALILRDNVRVEGVPGKTILAACDGLSTTLAADGDCNQHAITVADPSGFHVGDGVAIVDDRANGGFEVTTATIIARDGANGFRLSRPLYVDYLVSRKASARLVFPIVAGWQVKDVAVDGLTVEGNRGKSLALDGCRGGGIYLFECAGVAIKRCVVHDCAGDGISFQVSSKVIVEDCETHANAGHGLHPGSGSREPILRGNRSHGNGQDGLFVCWRVQHGLFSGNILQGNKRSGISIGHKDSDNLFQGNHITGNDSAGITFRNETEAMGAHRNQFQKNIILDNGKGQANSAIVISGVHHDVVFRDNVIGFSQAGAGTHTGIRASAAAIGLKADDNDFRNVNTRVEIK